MPEAACCALAVLLLVPGWLAILRRRDAWPWSWYPMFSQYCRPGRVEVYRVSLETEGGGRAWWQPGSPWLQELLGRQASRMVRAEGETRLRLEADLRAEIRHFVTRDPGSVEKVVAVCLVRRRMEEREGEWHATDEVFRRYELP